MGGYTGSGDHGRNPEFSECRVLQCHPSGAFVHGRASPVTVHPRAALRRLNRIPGLPSYAAFRFSRALEGRELSYHQANPLSLAVIRKRRDYFRDTVGCDGKPGVPDPTTLT